MILAIAYINVEKYLCYVLYVNHRVYYSRSLVIPDVGTAVSHVNRFGITGICGTSVCFLQLKKSDA